MRWQLEKALCVSGSWQGCEELSGEELQFISSVKIAGCDRRGLPCGAILGSDCHAIYSKGKAKVNGGLVH